MRIKTGISIDKDLFDKAEKMARELGISRSRLFSMGLQEIIGKQENRRLFERLNRALEKIYPDTEEEKHIRQMKEYHRKLFSSD
ncbi:CopG family transcriptional regulator [bacterium]|nr:CopG family transcriptional regulator [bacterium]MCI0603459.1 CopG family transcriptional regulator [bacterium]